MRAVRIDCISPKRLVIVCSLYAILIARSHRSRSCFYVETHANIALYGQMDGIGCGIAQTRRLEGHFEQIWLRFC